MRVVLDAMILAAGLTSRREPASFSRRLLEAVANGEVELVLTEVLLDETRAVMTDPDFVGHRPDALVGALLDGLQLRRRRGCGSRQGAPAAVC